MNKEIIILSGILIVGGGLVYFLSRDRSTLIDLEKVHNNRINRTDEELTRLAQAVKELYLMHGITLTREGLTDALQEFLDDEDAKPSEEVFRIIETRLTSGS